ncbi:MAG TPA: nickel-dependent lactate racemase [Negativicutes bacterium]|nr:nickel-dependent lactate racemase [Negativicutes bacterium]
MAATKVKLPYGRETVEVSIPAKNLVGVYSPKDVPPVADVRAEVARALNAPIGARPLREVAKGARKAVIVADDNTRLTPTDRIIPVLLDELNAAGVADDHITIIIALGTHRFMTGAEIAAKFGDEVVRRVKVKNHDYKNPAELIELGTTANGTYVAVNREVYEADFKIGVGSIVPHHIPGFAGGAKIVQPGISGERTTAETHLLSVRAPRSYLGVVDNPVRRELNEIARSVGLNTIFNTVLNRHGEVVGAFYGDVVAAFDAGVELSRAVYAVEVPEEADVVVASSHPCDLEFWQAHKTLYPSDLAVKAGGIIVLVTPCYEGVAVTHGDMLEITAKSSCAIRDMVSCKQVHDEVAAALAIAWAQVKEREAVYFVSSGIAAAEAEKLGFRPFASVQAAVDAALAAKGPGARVTVLTHAPDMLPVVKS